MSRGRVLGILGGGQLARMMAQAARPLGIDCVTLDPSSEACASAHARHLAGAFDDEALLMRLAGMCDAVTFEFENVPARSLEILERLVPIAPSPEALRVSSDRIAEKRLFEASGVAVGPYREVRSAADLAEAARDLGVPGVLKTCSGGYDGKGQRVVRAASDLEGASRWIGGRRCIYESFIGFDRELSIIACRSGGGEIVTYPLSENTHASGMLVRSVAPAEAAASVGAQAELAVRSIAQRLGYVGVLAIEFFEVGGRLLANEMAPRVHNTGHWTIEGAHTSQFENHVRAVMGLPLGATRADGHAVMLNIIGRMPPEGILDGTGAAVLHGYGKEARPGRKIGHITLTDPDARGCLERANLVQSRLRNLLGDELAGDGPVDRGAIFESGSGASVESGQSPASPG